MRKRDRIYKKSLKRQAHKTNLCLVRMNTDLKWHKHKKRWRSVARVMSLAERENIMNELLSELFSDYEVEG